MITSVLFELLFLNCILQLVRSLPAEINTSQNHIEQNITNKEMYIPIPVNNDKFNKLSINHNNQPTTASNTNQEQQLSNNEYNAVKNLKIKKSNDRAGQQNSHATTHDNTPPPHPPRQQQQIFNEDPIFPVSANRLLDRIYQLNLDNNLFRSRSNMIGQPIKTVHELYSKRRDDEFIDGDDDDDDYEIDRDKYDYYTNKNLKRIASLAKLLEENEGEVDKRSFNQRPNPFVVRSLQEDFDTPAIGANNDDDAVSRDNYNLEMANDDVMDSNDLANLMMEEEMGVSYLDRYIGDAIRNGLLEPRFANVYRSNVIKEYFDLLYHNRHHHQPDIDERRHERNIDSVRYLTKEIPELRLRKQYELEMMKKMSSSAGNKRQQELEDFASILKQVNLESELESLTRKNSD